jgi:raffinose/stachyose/melibiose transport system substrate-binding protein
MSGHLVHRSHRLWAGITAAAFVVVIGVAGLSVMLVGSGAGGTPSPAPPTPEPTPRPTPEPVTVHWWQLDAGEDGNAIWEALADKYMAAHPQVTIEIKRVAYTPTQIDDVVARVREADLAGRLPDLLPSWGGGVLAAEVEGGMLKDISADVASWKVELSGAALRIHSFEGSQYGVPWNLGLFGFWYNKALFARADIAAPPETWDEFLADVAKLKAAGIVPYAIGGKDGWPGLHLWTYLVLREGGSDALTQMIESGDWNTPACVAGGRRVAELVVMSPFQPGYMEAPYAAFGMSEAASMGNGEAAMELMGQWAEWVQQANSDDGQGIGGDLGWFPFPQVGGGMGVATDGVGGSDGIVVGRDAPPEAIDFLRFLVSPESASATGAAGLGLPVTAGTSSSVPDPLLQTVVAARDKTGFVQLFLDIADTQTMNAAMVSAVGQLFARTASPEQVCEAITQAAATR